MVVTKLFVYCSLAIVVHVKYQLISMVVVPMGVFDGCFWPSVHFGIQWLRACEFESMDVCMCLNVFKNGKISSRFGSIFFLNSFIQPHQNLHVP